MSSSLSKDASNSGKNTDRSTKGSEEGKEYEKITLVLLAERGYVLSKDNDSQFRDFSIGREVGIGEDRKLDDIVLRYEDRGSTNNLIFVQIKHKQDDSLKINYQVLFGSGSGNMGRDFKLRQYFISYLNIREELKTTKSIQLKNGKISYIAIFTNIGIDKMELKNKGIALKEAPDDIKSLFALKKSSFERREANHCYQLGIDDNVSDDLLSNFKKYGDLHRIAKDFAQFVVLEKYKNLVMGTNTAPVKYYHVALAKEVIEKTNEIGSEKQSMENKRHFYAKFRNDFIDNNTTGARKELLDSIFTAIRELKPKEDINDDEIKEILRKAEWRVVSHFGDYLPPENSPELSKIAKEFADYISNENETDKIIFGRKGSLITHYDVAFEREVIIISDEVKYKSPKKQNAKSESYCDAKFRDEFINSETGPKKVLKKAIFKAIMESDTSKKDSSDCELENVLRRVKLRVGQDFGKAQNFELDLPDKWPMIKDDDIKDFFKCLVLFVNQPIVTDLLKEIYPIKVVFLQGTPVGEAIEKLHKKFRNRIEKALGIYNKTSNEEVWLSGEQIIQFVQELQDAIHTCVMTFIYEEEKVKKYGKFKKIGKLASSLGNFLNDKWNKVFCICTPTTLLTIVKVLQYLDNKKYRGRYGQISIELDDLKQIRNRVEKAFRSDINKLLIIECRHTVNEHSVDELCRNYSGVIKESDDKKIIIICKQNESTLADKFRPYLNKLFQSDYDLEKLYVQQTDDVNLKEFEPEGNPMDKEVIVFQEQKVKINLARLTGFEDWENYVDYLSESIILNTTDIADIMIQILNSDEIEVGNKALGTSSLEGAYATLSEEINLDTLSNKLLSKEVENVSLCNDNLEKTLLTSFKEVNLHTLEQNLEKQANEIYIFDGIKGLNNKEKIAKLTEYLRLVNEQEEIENLSGSIGSDSKIQVANDQFTDENFKQICHNYRNKKILWIYVKYTENEVKFILREFYNPNFYLKRKFKFFEKVVISKKRIKYQLMLNCLSEIFIFHCINDRQEFTDSLQFNVSEFKQFQINSERSKIKICKQEDDVEAIFKECCRQNEIVHWLKCEKDQIVWCKSHGSLDNLRMFIDKDASEITLKEDDLIKEIKDKKVVIISDDPGMGKTTTITKLYESKSDPESYTATHWIIRIDLKDHLQAIRDIKLINGFMNAVSVVTFLSTVDAKLNHNISISLLEIILDRNKHFSKELLLVFDGFDEVLDECDRSKVISLLKFLKEDTPAKIWITTRLHYKRILENELSIFAIEFVPFDDEDKAAYIKKYLKDRLELILESKVFAELFSNNDEEKENETLQKYTNAFLNKMKSVFKENVFRFIGTPLQLYLMLEGSTKYFKIWIENELNEIPNFNYLGNDLLQIYENFIDRKYDVYFRKMGINEIALQDKDKFIFNKFNKDLAKSLILNSKLKNSLEKIKYTVLSAGLIKSNGCNIEFIHTTFRDYFAATVFVHWINEMPNELSGTNKQEYVLKEILNKSDYQLVRAFINFELKKFTEPRLLQEGLNHCGIIMKKLLRNEGEQSLRETVLHIAVEENNTNIACFLLSSLIEHGDVLKEFIFMRNKYNETALHLACCEGSIELVKILLVSVAIISDDTKGPKDVLKDFIFMCNDNKETALHLVCRGGSSELVTILLDAAAVISDDTEGTTCVLKDFIFMRNESKETSLHLACREENSTIVKILLFTIAIISDNTKRPKDAFNGFIFLYDKSKETALNLTYREGSSELIKILLDAAVVISDDTKRPTDVLKDFIFMCDDIENTALLLAIINLEHNFELFIIMLFAAAGNSDYPKIIRIRKCSLKQFIFMCNESKETALHIACSEGSSELVKILLVTAAIISDGTKGHKDVLKDFIFKYNENKETALHLACRKGSSEVVKILLDTVAIISDDTKGPKDVVKDFILMCNVSKETVLHFASMRKDGQLFKILLDSAAENSKYIKAHKDILKEFIFMRNESEETALHVSCREDNCELVKILLNAATLISDDTKGTKNALKDFIFMGNDSKETALHLACLKESSELVKILLDTVEIISDNTKGAKDVLKDFIFLCNEHKETALHLASRRKDVQLFTILLDAVVGNSEYTKSNKNALKKFIFMRDERGETALHVSCRENNCELVKILLNAAALISDDTKRLKHVLRDFIFICNKRKETALHLASMGKDGKLITILLEAAAGNLEYIKGHKDVLKEFILMRNKRGETALHVSCRKDNCEVVKILLNAAAVISDDPKGPKNILKDFIFMCKEIKETALHLACREGSFELVKMLLDTVVIISDETKGPKDVVTDIIFMCNERKETALHLASRRKDRKIITLLLDAAAGNSEYTKGHIDVLKEFIFMRNEREETALHVSCREDNSELVKILLNGVAVISDDTKGPKDVLKDFIFMCNETKETALHLACREGSCELVKMLLDTVVIISNDTKGPKDVVKDFIFMCNQRKETALHLASMRKGEKLITILLDAAAGNSEYTKGQIDVLKEFIFMRNEREETALHVSCREGNIELVKILLNAVAVISDDTKGYKDYLQEFIFMRDIRGDTALHLACTVHKKRITSGEELARILLESAARISEDIKGHKDVLKKFILIGDKNGDTALHLACEGENVALVTTLIETAARISEDTLQEFIFSLNNSRDNAFDKLILWNGNVQICKELLKRANNKLALIANYEKKCNFAFLAFIGKKQDFLKAVFEEFKHDENSLKQLLLKHGTGNALYNCIFKLPANLYSSVVVECFLSAAKSINDNNETLKKLLLPGEILFRPLNKAIEKENIFIVEMILSFAKDIDDGNYTLKKLLYNTTTQESALVISIEDWRCNTLHIACIYGNIEVIKVLISYAISINDGGTTLKELVTSTNLNNFTPFQLLKNGYTDEIKQVVESFITKAKINNDEDVVNILEEINVKYAGVTFPFTII